MAANDKVIFPFTAARLTALPAPATGRVTYRDAGCRGLILAVTAKGAKSFYLYKRIGGAPRRLRLGSFPPLTVADARRAVLELIGVAATGRDPTAARREKAGLTVAEAFTYRTTVKAGNKSLYADTCRYKRHLATWGNWRLEEITTRDVARLHAKVGKATPHEANRVLALVSSLWSAARRGGLTRAVNPCTDVPRFRERSRDRFLSAAELRRFLAAVATCWSTDAADVFMLLLLTGARRGNVESMQWSALDLVAGTWHISAGESKAGESMTIVLVPAAVNVLERRRLSADPAAPWVFPSSSSNSGHLEGQYRCWRSIVKAAGLEGLRMHDLRRTFGSWQAAAGVSLPIIGKTLGHQSLAATAVYARLDLAPVRAAVTAATQAMLATADAPIEGRLALADGKVEVEVEKVEAEAEVVVEVEVEKVEAEVVDVEVTVTPTETEVEKATVKVL